jgi:hypothetical protein
VRDLIFGGRSFDRKKFCVPRNLKIGEQPEAHLSSSHGDLDLAMWSWSLGSADLAIWTLQFDSMDFTNL